MNAEPKKLQDLKAFDTSKKSIGIITFSNYTNYGSALQEFALSSLLNDTYEVKSVNFLRVSLLGEMRIIRTDFVRKIFLILSFLFHDLTKKIGSDKNKNGYHKKSTKKKLTKHFDVLFNELISSLYLMLKDILNISNRRKLINNYKSFWNKYITFTQGYTSEELMSGKCEHFDIYMSGSDQVWNITWLDYLTERIYFLDFAGEHAQKISFASSFGNFSFDNEQKLALIGQLLPKYSHISVREAKSVLELKKHFGIDAFHALDPTLMLTKEQWLNRLDIKDRYGEQRYLLVYALYKRGKTISFAKKLAKKFDLYVYIIDMPFFARSDSKVKYFPAAGPVEFVKLFAGASFVVTNSFHGTAFSVNFNIPFLTLKSHMPERAMSFLQKVQLSDRIISYDNEINDSNINNVNFETANRILNNERKLSMEYLKNAVEN